MVDTASQTNEQLDLCLAMFWFCPAAHDSFRTGTVQRNFLPKRLTRLRCFTFDCFRSDLKMSLDNYAILLESSDPCSFCLLFGTYIVIFSHSNHSTLILPLCWRISYENLAILSIATASGGLHRPSFWQAVHDQIRTSVFEVIPSCCLKLLILLQQWQKERWLWWLVIGCRKSVSIIRVYFLKKSIKKTCLFCDCGLEDLHAVFLSPNSGSCPGCFGDDWSLKAISRVCSSFWRLLFQRNFVPPKDWPWDVVPPTCSHIAHVLGYTYIIKQNQTGIWWRWSRQDSRSTNHHSSLIHHD
jgi:hypothetical protein